MRPFSHNKYQPAYTQSPSLNLGLGLATPYSKQPELFTLLPAYNMLRRSMTGIKRYNNRVLIRNLKSKLQLQSSPPRRCKIHRNPRRCNEPRRLYSFRGLRRFRYHRQQQQHIRRRQNTSSRRLHLIRQRQSYVMSAILQVYAGTSSSVVHSQTDSFTYEWSSTGTKLSRKRQKQGPRPRSEKPKRRQRRRSQRVWKI